MSVFTVHVKGARMALVRADALNEAFPVRPIDDYAELEVDLPDARLTTQRYLDAILFECACLNDTDYHVLFPEQEVHYVISPLQYESTLHVMKRTFTFELEADEVNVLRGIMSHLQKDKQNPMPYLPVTAAQRPAVVRRLIRKGMIEHVGFGYQVTRLAFMFINPAEDV